MCWFFERGFMMGSSYRVKTLVKAGVSLVVLALLSALIFFSAGRKKASQKSIQETLLVDFSKTEVLRLQLEHQGMTTVLEPNGVDFQGLPAWRMIKPVQAEGDGITINSLLTRLSCLDAIHRLDVSQQASLAAYGLDPPLLSWTVTRKHKTPLKLLLGQKSPQGDSRYVKLGGNPQIFLVEQFQVHPLIQTSFDLREKRLVPWAATRINRLSLQFAGQIELRYLQKQWRLVKPVKARADQERVRKIIASFLRLKAASFKKEKIQALTQRWQATLKWPAHHRLDLVGLSGKEDRQYVRAQPNGVLVLVSKGLDTRHWSVSALRSRKVLSFKESSISRIKISSDDALIVLEKFVGSGWKMISPLAIDVLQEKVQLLLRGLLALRVKSFAPHSALTNPSFNLSLFDGNGRELGEVQVGKRNSDRLLVKGSGLDSCVWVLADSVFSLPITVDEFRREKP
jgi:hypothetical protein